MIQNYIKKYQLNRKKAFVIGGVGLIGKEITTALGSAGAEVFVLDLKQKKKEYMICRSCRTIVKVKFVDLKFAPISNAYVNKENLNKIENISKKSGNPGIFVI